MYVYYRKSFAVFSALLLYVYCSSITAVIARRCQTDLVQHFAHNPSEGIANLSHSQTADSGLLSNGLKQCFIS
jgi:hypothetical protein